jgi:excisionase family DNA binding protein
LVTHDEPRKQGSTDYLMSVEELRRFLGIGRTYAYCMLARGEMPTVRLGRALRVRRSEVERYVEEHTRRRRSRGGADAA